MEFFAPTWLPSLSVIVRQQICRLPLNAHTPAPDAVILARALLRPTFLGTTGDQVFVPVAPERTKSISKA
jgi:hypothetical protein